MPRNTIRPSLDQAYSEIRQGHYGLAEREINKFMAQLNINGPEEPRPSRMLGIVPSKRADAARLQAQLDFDQANRDGRKLLTEVKGLQQSRRNGESSTQGAMAPPQRPLTAAAPSQRMRPPSYPAESSSSFQPPQAAGTPNFRLSTASVMSRGTILPSFEHALANRPPDYWENQGPEIWQNRARGSMGFAPLVSAFSPDSSIASGSPRSSFEQSPRSSRAASSPRLDFADPHRQSLPGLPQGSRPASGATYIDESPVLPSADWRPRRANDASPSRTRAERQAERGTARSAANAAPRQGRGR